jgi:DNA processing protein
VSDVATTAVARITQLPYSIRKTLWDKWGTAERLLEGVRAHQSADSTEEAAFSILEQNLDLKQAETEVSQLKKLGGWVVGFGDSTYPKLLSEIPDPPLALFGLGTLPGEDRPFLGFVGPRRPSTYGTRVARMLAKDLAREGVILVSGLARGIDAIAHEAALREKTPTVAVMGCGLDRIYPPEHALLHSKVVRGGAVLSEFFLREPPRPEHFPRRNRIISGLSRGVLLVEAGEKSGARITARHAVEQCREVFAVPGPIDSSLSIHPNRLISEGAKLVATSADVLEELIPGYGGRKPAGVEIQETKRLSPMETELLTCMERDRPLAVDDLVKESKLPIQSVLQTLSGLQIKGLVEKQSDARYVRTVGEL